MESMSLQQVQVVEELLKQIQQAIANLEDWNAQLSSVDDLLTSPDGMKTLAAERGDRRVCADSDSEAF